MGKIFYLNTYHWGQQTVRMNGTNTPDGLLGEKELGGPAPPMLPLTSN